MFTKGFRPQWPPRKNKHIEEVANWVRDRMCWSNFILTTQGSTVTIVFEWIGDEAKLEGLTELTGMMKKAPTVNTVISPTLTSTT